MKNADWAKIGTRTTTSLRSLYSNQKRFKRQKGTKQEFAEKKHNVALS